MGSAVIAVTVTAVQRAFWYICSQIMLVGFNLLKVKLVLAVAFAVIGVGFFKRMRSLGL